MVAMATSMIRKKKIVKKYNLDTRLSFDNALKGYKNFDFFTKSGRHILSDTPVH